MRKFFSLIFLFFYLWLSIFKSSLVFIFSSSRASMSPGISLLFLDIHTVIPRNSSYFKIQPTSLKTTTPQKLWRSDASSLWDEVKQSVAKYSR